MPLTPPKPINLDYDLSNPYSKPKPTNTGIVSTNFYQKPQGILKPVQVGNVKVDTKNPVLVEPTGLALPKPEQQQNPVESAGFWARKSNKQKAMFIGVGLIAVIAIVAFTKKK